MRKINGAVKIEPRLNGAGVLVLRAATGETIGKDLTAEEAGQLADQLIALAPKKAPQAGATTKGKAKTAK